MLTIGKLSLASGVKVPTIRYCDEIGLWRKAERSAGNQRLYGRKAHERLTFIRHAREPGFLIDAIRDLLGLSDQPDQSCAAAIAFAQLAAVKACIARLTELTVELERMLIQCAGGVIADCRVIEVFGDHATASVSPRPSSGY